LFLDFLNQPLKLPRISKRFERVRGYFSVHPTVRNEETMSGLQREIRGFNWTDTLRLLAMVGLLSASRYYSSGQLVSIALLLVAFLLLLWLLLRLFRFLWQRFLQQRWPILNAWFVCKKKQCDYYQIYQAYGPADLTHVGYHAGERLALEHFVSHSEEPGSSLGCEVCKSWGERLRGEFWNTLAAENHRIESDATLETKRRQYGFLAGVDKTRGK